MACGSASLVRMGNVMLPSCCKRIASAAVFRYSGGFGQSLSPATRQTSSFRRKVGANLPFHEVQKTGGTCNPQDRKSVCAWKLLKLYRYPLTPG